MRLFLVRHARTAWNAELRAQGHTDIPLDEEGERQARLLAPTFQHFPVRRVLSSDLTRSVHTAQAIANHIGAELTLEPLLRERAYGDWEGLRFDHFRGTMEQMQRSEGLGPYDVRPPGGESLTDAWKRIAPVSEWLHAQAEPLVVVSHGGICSLLLAQLIRGSLETSRAFRFHNSAVTELLKRPEGEFRLMRFNDTSHLDEFSGYADAAAR